VEKLFDFERFDIKLEAETIGRKFYYFDECKSTNTSAFEKTEEAPPHGGVFFAERQSEGRGRHDRRWLSARGMNLTFSVLLTDKAYFNDPPLVGFAAANGAAQAVENLFQLRAETKWPNDVLVGGKKIAGVLPESQSSGSNVERIVVGIGMNVNQTDFQGEFKILPTSVRLELGHLVERERVLAETLTLLENQFEKLRQDPALVVNDWRNRCRALGDIVSVRVGEETKTGVFDDVDDRGRLLLKFKDESIETVASGEIVA
jgi:BirA family transcriptional regulator, biotin operon repressor / biotin---[acetyl-CoA-carboxylase] ligase